MQARQGDIAASKETFVRAADTARAAGLPEHLARAALGYGGRFVWARAWGDERLVPLLEEALAALPAEDGELRARLLARLAGGPYRDTLAPEPRERIAKEAVDMARRLGDPGTLAYTLEGRYDADWGPDALDRRLAIADELLALAAAVGDAERAYAGHDCRFIAMLEAGDLAGARRSHEAAMRLADQLRQPAQLWDSAARRALLALYDGRLAEAESFTREAFALGQSVQTVNAQLVLDLQLYALRREQGRLAEVAEIVERAVDEYPGYPVWRYVLIDVLAELGRTADARAVLARAGADDYEVYLDMQWLFSMSLLADVCRSLDDADTAEAVYARLLPYAHRNAVLPPELCFGSVSRALGNLAATASRRDDAVRHLEIALAMNAAGGSETWLAYTQYDLGRTLLERGGAGDRLRAEGLLATARVSADALGLRALAAKVGALPSAVTSRDLFLLDPESSTSTTARSARARDRSSTSTSGGSASSSASRSSCSSGGSGDELAGVREALGAFVGAPADDLALVLNATAGLNAVLRSLPLAAGDEILTTEHEYGAIELLLAFVAERTGARVVRAAGVDADAIWAAATPRTRVLVVSHVTSPTALVLPVEELCRRAREADVLSVVDGAHGPGQVPLDLERLGADFYAGNCHKWLCAPKGAGFLYARPERQQLVQPLVDRLGLRRVRRSRPRHDWQSTRDPAAYLAVPAAIEFVREHGRGEECRELLRQGVRQLGEAGFEPIAPEQPLQMAAFRLPTCDPDEVQRRLIDEFRIEVPGSHLERTSS